MFKVIRISLLTLVLVIVVGNYWLDQNKLQSWDESIWVGIYPVNASIQSTGSKQINQYINKQLQKDLNSVSDWIQKQAKLFNMGNHQIIHFEIKHTVFEKPPAPPIERSRFAIAMWSIKFRYWVWKQQHSDEPSSDLDLFYILEPTKNRPVLHIDNSFALQKVGAGVINAIADRSFRGHNQLILAHELMHLFGATDKYDLATNLPKFPDGYADPASNPLHPQKMAELMGGRIPINKTLAVMPKNLSKVIIGNKTAKEIGW
ncbi:MAG: hypothetical protein ACWA5R_06255 [bacterium]